MGGRGMHFCACGTQLIWSVPTRTMDSGRAEAGSNESGKCHRPFRPAGGCVAVWCGWAVLTLSTSNDMDVGSEGTAGCWPQVQVLKQEQSAKWPASRSVSLLHVGLSVKSLAKLLPCR
jgi:hypothetical protein